MRATMQESERGNARAHREQCRRSGTEICSLARSAPAYRSRPTELHSMSSRLRLPSIAPLLLLTGLLLTGLLLTGACGGSGSSGGSGPSGPTSTALTKPTASYPYGDPL